MSGFVLECRLGSDMPIRIRCGDEAAYARYLASKAAVSRADLTVGFEPCTAADPLLLVDGAQFYPPLLADLARATSSIHIIEFGIRPGGVADRFAGVLADKAREGVAARVIADARGSNPGGGSRELFERLAGAGVEVFVNHPFAPRVPVGPLGCVRGRRWNLRSLLAVDHRKAIIIDGRVGWVGTAGIEDRFEDGSYHDLFVRIEGPVLHQLQAVFLASYRWHGGAYSVCAVDELFPALEAGERAVPAIVLHNAPGRYRPISREIVDLIASARRRLDIMNPYVAHPGMFRLMREAARRGVRVRLIVPPEWATQTTGYARLHHYAGLMRAGVEVWIYPSIAHAKAFVRDDCDILVGSCNLETWSLRRFFELDVRVQSEELAEQFRTKLFEPDVAASTPARPARGLKQRALSSAFHLISPFL
jgi:cardiolipin synthase